MNWELLEENKCFYEYDVLDRSLVVCELQEVKHSWIFYNSTVTMVSTCSECCLTKELKFFCSCKFAAYCSKFCKTKNKYAHQGRCPKNAESDD